MYTKYNYGKDSLFYRKSDNTVALYNICEVVAGEIESELDDYRGQERIDLGRKVLRNPKTLYYLAKDNMVINFNKYENTTRIRGEDAELICALCYQIAHKGSYMNSLSYKGELAYHIGGEFWSEIIDGCLKYLVGKRRMTVNKAYYITTSMRKEAAADYRILTNDILKIEGELSRVCAEPLQSHIIAHIRDEFAKLHEYIKNIEVKPVLAN